MKESQNRLLDVFSRERERFLSFIRRQTWELSHLDPEDILSDVFQNLFSKADLVGEAEYYTAYIYRSLSNRIIDSRRRSASRAEDPDVVQHLADPGPGADDLVHAGELRERLDQAMGALKPGERSVWIATEVDGKTFRQLSQETGEPVGTLLARKNRAKTKLRRLLADLNQIPGVLP